MSCEDRSIEGFDESTRDEEVLPPGDHYHM